MSCQADREETKRTSTLPPPCYHCKPPPFCCPKDGCPPPQACPPRRCCCPPSCPPLTCRAPPEIPSPPPSICIAGPCPERPGPIPHRCPMRPKISPPRSCVQYCINYTCGKAIYSPCYSAERPRCPSANCC